MPSTREAADEGPILTLREPNLRVGYAGNLPYSRTKAALDSKANSRDCSLSVTADSRTDSSEARLTLGDDSFFDAMLPTSR